MKRLHFAIRDLHWLVVVVGLGLGWWRDRQLLSKEADLRDLKYQMQTIMKEKLIRDLQRKLDAALDPHRLQER